MWNMYFLMHLGWALSLESWVVLEYAVVRACLHSEGNPLEIWLLLMDLEKDQEQVCVAAVMDCTAGYGDDRFLAAGFPGGKDK